jgi:hypothetical protein
MQLFVLNLTVKNMRNKVFSQELLAQSSGMPREIINGEQLPDGFDVYASGHSDIFPNELFILDEVQVMF